MLQEVGYLGLASKGGTMVGRMKDPLNKDSYLGITPPTFILPFEAPETQTGLVTATA